MAKTVLHIEDLYIDFDVHAGTVQAIRGINLKIKEGEVVCLVGESGSGKSVTAKSVIGLLPKQNTTISGGKILLNGVDVANMKEKEFELIRGKEAAMIFQDPMTSLNPIFSIGKQIKEAVLLHHMPNPEGQSSGYKHEYESIKHDVEEYEKGFLQRKKEIIALDISDEDKTKKFNENISNKNEFYRVIFKRRKKAKKKIPKKYWNDKVLEYLELVDITDPKKIAKQYPHQLSGGMRQRIVIAIALACEPRLLIADEPTTALDVTVQAKVLELIKRLQKKFNFAVLFITHDLGVVAQVADYVAVMYAGKIVERGTKYDIFYNSRHPYTWGLLASMPDIFMDGKEKLYMIPGTPPNLLKPPKGDAFASRNAYAMDIDFVYEPPMFELSETHQAATWLLDKRAPEVEPPKLIIEKMKKYEEVKEQNGKF